MAWSSRCSSNDMHPQQAELCYGRAPDGPRGIRGAGLWLQEKGNRGGYDMGVCGWLTEINTGMQRKGCGSTACA